MVWLRVQQQELTIYLSLGYLYVLFQLFKLCGSRLICPDPATLIPLPVVLKEGQPPSTLTDGPSCPSFRQSMCWTQHAHSMGRAFRLSVSSSSFSSSSSSFFLSFFLSSFSSSSSSSSSFSSSVAKSCSEVLKKDCFVQKKVRGLKEEKNVDSAHQCL